MIWVGSFKSLQTVLGKHRFTGAPLDVHTRVRSEIALISPLVDWLMKLIAISYGASVGLVPANALALTKPPPFAHLEIDLVDLGKIWERTQTLKTPRKLHRINRPHVFRTIS